MTGTTLLRLLAWGLLAALVLVTLSPIGLRPVSMLPVQAERALALAIVGLFFALAYPRHIWLVSAIVLGSTAILELLQMLAPGRDGRLLDLAVKLAGGACGLAFGWLLSHRQRG